MTCLMNTHSPSSYHFLAFPQITFMLNHIHTAGLHKRLYNVQRKPLNERWRREATRFSFWNANLSFATPVKKWLFLKEHVLLYFLLRSV